MAEKTPNTPVRGNSSMRGPSARFLPIALRQSTQFAYLLPFLFKEVLSSSNAGPVLTEVIR